jgi:hypothetical protein
LCAGLLCSPPPLKPPHHKKKKKKKSQGSQHSLETGEWQVQGQLELNSETTSQKNDGSNNKMVKGLESIFFFKEDTQMTKEVHEKIL